MRILAVSEDPRNLEDVKKLAASVEAITELASHEGSLAGMTALPMKGDVDILILDCRHNGVAQLNDLERLMAFYPKIHTIMVIEHESPDMLLRALRLGVREVMKTPLIEAEFRSAIQHIVAKIEARPRGEGRTLAFMSCKGGSGATFIATNLGYALASTSGKRVLLIDLNLQFGDAVLYLSDHRPRLCLPDVVRNIQQIDMSLLSSSLIDVLPNYSILAAPEDPTQSVDIRPSQIESLIRFARANFDYVLLDVGRSLDTCSIQALDLSDHIYPVMQLTLPFLRDAKRLFDVYRSLGYSNDKVRGILNRVERSAGELTERDAEKMLAFSVYASIPNHYKSVTASVNQGVPILALDHGSPVSQRLNELAQGITGIENPKPRGMLSRLLGRAST